MQRTMATIAVTVLCLSTPVTHASDPELSRDEFERLRKELHLKGQPWATIDWKISLTEARRAAANQGRPVFMVVNTGNCLGFV